VIGIIFAIGQEARGAHFLSHDLTSALVVWVVLLGLDRALLWNGTNDDR
jgi:membrane-associated PAP2 superfamily phosphatase